MLNLDALEDTKYFVRDETYKSNMEIEYGIRPTKRLKRIIVDFTRLAYDEKIDELQSFIDANPKACEVIPLIPNKILLYALLRKQFKAYAVLNSNGFELPYENEGRTRRFETLTRKELVQLRNEIRRRFVSSKVYLEADQDPNMSDLVKKLMEKTKLSSKRYHMNRFQEMKWRYMSLEVMDEIYPMLVVIADSKLKIVCSFFEASVGHILPGIPCVQGYCSFDFEMVLVKGNYMRVDAMKLIVHEFTHYVLWHLYDNKAYPFKQDDVEGREAYLKAYEACKEASKKVDRSELVGTLAIFDDDYKYEQEPLDEERKHTEAITLPPSFPINKTRKELMRYKKFLKPLFDFYYRFPFQDIIEKAIEVGTKWKNEKQTS